MKKVWNCQGWVFQYRSNSNWWNPLVGGHVIFLFTLFKVIFYVFYHNKSLWNHHFGEYELGTFSRHFKQFHHQDDSPKLAWVIEFHPSYLYTHLFLQIFGHVKGAVFPCEPWRLHQSFEVLRSNRCSTILGTKGVEHLSCFRGKLLLPKIDVFLLNLEGRQK